MWKSARSSWLITVWLHPRFIMLVIPISAFTYRVDFHFVVAGYVEHIGTNLNVLNPDAFLEANVSGQRRHSNGLFCNNKLWLM